MGGWDPLRGIIIGSGYFAPIQLEAWRAVERAKIVAVASIDDPERRAQVAAAAGVERHGDDVPALIEELQPDFLDICTPPAAHGQYVRLAADHGLPVLCQKPLAPSLSEAAELVAYCEQRQVPLQINENWRWQAWYQEIHRLLDSGTLGEPYHLVMQMRPGDGWGPNPYPEQPYFAQMPRFLLIETGLHYFDTTQLLLGDIEAVTCHLRTINPQVRAEDFAVVLLDCAGGRTAVYDANRTGVVEQVRSPAYGRLTLECEHALVRMNDQGELFLTRRGEREVPHPYPMPPGWKGGCAIAAQQHFVDVLHGKVTSQALGAHHLRILATVEACYRSAEQRRTVPVTEFLGTSTPSTPAERPV